MKKLVMTIVVERSIGELNTHNVEHALKDIADGYEVGSFGGWGGNGCGLGWKWKAAVSTDPGKGSAALTTAIRAFTIDMPNDQPNGEREKQLDLLGQALDRGDIRAARKAYSLMCEAGADDLKALRVAAEEHFGEDFRAVPS